MLRDFINFFGKPQIFQFTNNPEFKNNVSLAFFTTSYYLQSNEMVKAV